MDSLRAFAMGESNRGRPIMVFDWWRAVRLIRERKATEAFAGLSGDWEYTGGVIFKNGLPVPADETYTYLASTWARPLLGIDGILIDCFVMQDEAPEPWDAKTYWPESALALLDSV